MPTQLTLPSRPSAPVSSGNSRLKDSRGFVIDLNDVGDIALAERPSKKFVLDVSSELDGCEDLAENLSQLRVTLRIIGPYMRQSLQASEAGWAQIKPELDETIAIGLAGVREYLSSIQFWSPNVDRLWIDVASAQEGDLEAAHRLSTRISWNPNQWQREAIRLRARTQGTSPFQVQQDCLTKGVSLALGWKGDQIFPLLVQPTSAWLYDSDQTLSSVHANNFPAPMLWEWIREEAARAAGLWLVGHPYAPTVVLAEPPDVDGDWHLAKFTSENPQDTPRGRPFGNGIFEDGQTFLEEIRLAVGHVQAGGQRVTQERVAGVLSQRSLLGSNSADRQLRRWVKEFGYASWRDLLARL